MGAIASQVTSLTIVYSTVYPDADQRKHQSSASLAFVRGIHRGPVNSPHKWPVTRKMLPFDDVIMISWSVAAFSLEDMDCPHPVIIFPLGCICFIFIHNLGIDRDYTIYLQKFKQSFTKQKKHSVYKPFCWYMASLGHNELLKTDSIISAILVSAKFHRDWTDLRTIITNKIINSTCQRR